MATATIEEALAAIRRGEMVVVVDDESRENEGDLIMGAQFASAEKIAFYLRHTSGLICVALEPKRLEDLNLPLMVNSNTEFQRTAFTVTVDALETSTGISAQDRARTIAALIDPETTPGSLRRPGHVFPLRYCEGGVLTRPGHTEAAIDLARMAGINPAGMLCEIVAADKRDMARMPDLELFAKTYDLLLITIADLVKYRRDTERLVERVSTAHIPTELGNFTGHVFRSLLDGEEHFALVAGDVTCDEPVLIRVHSECLSGDIFHSLRCDCGAQLEAARTAILAEGRGVIIYLRGGVGRGIGLAHTFSTCSVQRKEFTRGHVDLQLGLTGESGAYWTASQILMDLNVRRWKLMDSPAATCGGIGKFKDEEALVEQVAAPEGLIKAARPAASG